MTGATLTFEDDIEELIREIAREEIKTVIDEQIGNILKTVISTVAKTAVTALAKSQAPQQNLDSTINATQLADAVKAKLAERQAQQAAAQSKPKPRKAAPPKVKANASQHEGSNLGTRRFV